MEDQSNLKPVENNEPTEPVIQEALSVPQINKVLEAALARNKAGEATAEDRQLLSVFELGASFGANQALDQIKQSSPENESDNNRFDNREESVQKTVDERTISGNLLDAANKRIADVGAQIDTIAGWGDDTTDLRTELKGHEDFRDYLKSRDYKDKSDNVHDAQTGKFKKEELANTTLQTETTEDLSSLKLQGQDGLLEKWAEAEDRDLSTLSEAVEDELLRRLDNEQNLSDEQKTAYIDRLHAQMTKLREPVPTTVDNLEQPNQDTDEKPDTEENVEANEQESSGPSAAEIEAIQAQKYDVSVLNYAHAKIASERLLAGKEAKQNLEVAENALKQSFNEMLGSIPDTMRLADQLLQNSIDDNQTLLGQAQERLASIQAEIAKQGDNRDEESSKQVASLEKEIQERLTIASDLSEKIEQSAADAAAYMTQRNLELRKAVDGAVLKERIQARGKVGKAAEWLRSHPKVRIGVGLGLTGLGFVGAASFNAPLVAIATGGKALLRGIGSYEVVRGAGEMLASHRLNQADMSTVEGYLAASKQESTTLRNSKRIGALIGAGMALGPLTYQLVESFQHTNIESATMHLNNATTPSPAHEVLNVQPVDGNTAPWTFGMNSLHTNLSDPSTLAKLVHNTAGIKFFGNGLGGGQGAITRVFIPGQGNFSDLGHINGAIQFVLGGKA
jgi:hypothetical protein